MAVVGHVFPDIDVQNADGDTALHLAAEYDQPGVIETLLKHKADFHKVHFPSVRNLADSQPPSSRPKVNKFDFSPIQIAAIKCHNACLVPLIKYGDSESLLALTSCKESLLHLGRN